MRGDNLVVHGWMGPQAGAGCRLAHNRSLAVCRLAGADRIEVDMGPSKDFVEVTERLPLPLTVDLGDGSDKFIGNGEPDTCYSEGARRNRCVGGGGNDICITGDQEQRLCRRRRGLLLPDRRRQRRLLGWPRRRRLQDGTRPGRLPRRRRSRQNSTAAPAPISSMAAKATTPATACPAGGARTNATPAPGATGDRRRVEFLPVSISPFAVRRRGRGNPNEGGRRCAS